MEKKFNSYGLLITVSSLLMIVSYSGDRYDGWDAVIALFGLWFGFSYLKYNMSDDWFSHFVSVFIMISSLFSLAIAFVLNFEMVLAEDIKKFTTTENAFFSTELNYILISSICLSFISNYINIPFVSRGN